RAAWAPASATSRATTTRTSTRPTTRRSWASTGCGPSARRRASPSAPTSTRASTTWATPARFRRRPTRSRSTRTAPGSSSSASTTSTTPPRARAPTGPTTTTTSAWAAPSSAGDAPRDARSTRAARHPVLLAARGRRELGPLVGVEPVHREHDVRGERADARRPFHVDAQRLVTDLVVVVVEAGEEEEHRHLAAEEGPVVGVARDARLVLHDQALAPAEAREQLREERRGARGPDHERPAAQAADHVEVEHEHRARQRPQRVADVVRAAEQAAL